jgi:hypothetical protein
MQKTRARKPETGHKEPKTLQGLLLSALDMEDEIAHSVYQDYMKRENWPTGLKDESFEEIQKYLIILLKETEQHRNIIRQLQSKLGQNDG